MTPDTAIQAVSQFVVSRSKAVAQAAELAEDCFFRWTPGGRTLCLYLSWLVKLSFIQIFALLDNWNK